VARVTIDGQRCQGHGRCALIAPQSFYVDDSGVGTVLASHEFDTDTTDVAEAVLSCPEYAISVVD
jgi:ferredoxin